MKTTFEDRLQNAAVFLQEDKLQDSIEEYSEALQHTENQDQKIALYTVLGRLYQRLKMPKKAITAFQKSLKLLEAAQLKDQTSEIASVHNNLAAAFLLTDVSMAISHYKEALAIYEKLNKTADSAYNSHCANTLFAIGEAFVQNEKAQLAKSNYKKAIRLYESLPDMISLQARAHYQLGIIYTDEFNLFDAKTQYAKALTLYEKLASEGNPPNAAIMAALHNNMAITYKSMGEYPKVIDAYERSLELYRALTVTHPDVFLPYVAATLSSLGISFANTQELDKAVSYMRQAVDTYNTLSDSSPDQYTHYLATALHNLGLFYFEDRDLLQAEHFLTEALMLRKKLVMTQPEAFGPDVCATALNLVELYQTSLEDQLDISYRTKSLGLLQEVEELLKSYKDDRVVLKNMRNDCTYYQKYFNEISLETLSLQYLTKKASEFKEEINSTILPSEKFIFQEKLISLLEEKQALFPENNELNALLTMAYNDLAWLLLRMNQPKKAQTFIKKGQTLDNNSLLLKCNLAHCFLLKKEPKKALDHYITLLETDANLQENFMSIIQKDLETLVKDGVDRTLIDDIRKELSI